jgi:hypothetical protein
MAHGAAVDGRALAFCATCGAGLRGDVAIWLNPNVDWRNDYKRWPALEKLEYVEGFGSRARMHRTWVARRQGPKGLTEWCTAANRRCLPRLTSQISPRCQNGLLHPRLLAAT